MVVNFMKCDIQAGLLSSLFETPMTGLSGENDGWYSMYRKIEDASWDMA